MVKGAAGGTRGRGFESAGGDAETDEEVVFAQGRETKPRDEEKRKSQSRRLPRMNVARLEEEEAERRKVF